jgi:hypothetical protein
MKRSSQPRVAVELSKPLTHQLNMYALAAGAAGVGLLALARPAEAKIIYTPAHTPIIESINIDLNHDGVFDFLISSYADCGGGYCWAKVRAFGPQGNGVAARTHYGVRLASALKKGNVINRKLNFTNLATMLSYGEGMSGGGYWGYWYDVTNRYLGLQFQIKGKTHYGWARFSIKDHGLIIDGILTGYAYETIPNKPIIAGKTKGPHVTTVSPASLGHLAAGASAIRAWRVKQAAETTH